MAGGAAFADVLAGWLGKHAPAWDRMVVFVPTVRVAARVRAKLAVGAVGVLPAVLPLKGTSELADLLALPLPTRTTPMAARLEIHAVLKKHEAALAAETGATPMQGERLWRRVDGLYKLLERLALHGVAVRDLRRTVPEHLAGFWNVQAATLLAVATHMEHWLARRGEVLPCAAERRILEQAAQVLGQEGGPWLPVVAGVLDGVPAAMDVVKAASAHGHVLVPRLGPVTAELARSGLQDYRITEFPQGGGEVIAEVAETDWDEAWLAALGVRRAVEEGQRRVAVVSPSQDLLQRVSGLLERWGMAVPVTCRLCLDETPEARALLATVHWGLHHGTPAHWLDRLAALDASTMRAPVWAAITAALEPLRPVDAWLALEDWRAVMALALGDAPAPTTPVAEGIFLMGPLDARLLDFDSVIAAGAVEGVWPAVHADRWLSEAHLRALGMPDMERRALLAGTEFESVVHGGSTQVRVLRARQTDGKEMVPSRFLTGLQGLRQPGPREGLGPVLEAMRAVEKPAGRELGIFTPAGDLWPKRWSASFVEALLACPYKAIAERVLRLEPPAPLTPTPDARTAGLLAHRWLERAGKEAGFQDPGAAGAEDGGKALVARLLELAELELEHEAPVVRAVWRGKFAKLAPALVARWLEDHRTVATVEQKLEREVGHVTLTAKLDRVENQGAGAVIIDFKTSTPPAWAKVASGERPQLALEAWLMRQAGEIVADVEYWQLKGYGMSPLIVTAPGKKYPLEALLEPVKDGMARLAAAHGEGLPFPAVPDMEGGGLVATGHCERCALAGVCRRKDVRTAGDQDPRGGL